MRSAQLRDGIVAIADQHAIIKGARFFQGRAVVVYRLAAEQIFQSELGIAQELIQECATQALGRAAVTRKQRPGYFLGKLQTKNRSLEVRKKRDQTLLFFGGKFTNHSANILISREAVIWKASSRREAPGVTEPKPKGDKEEFTAEAQSAQRS